MPNVIFHQDDSNTNHGKNPHEYFNLKIFNKKDIGK